MIADAPRTERWLLVTTCLLFAAWMMSHAAFVPMWDSGQYVDCLMEAVQAGSWRGLNCFKHPTLAYMSVLALPQLVSPGSVVVLHATNTLLGIAALLLFHSLSRRVSRTPVDAALVTAAVAALPMFGANLLDATPDFGVMIFLLAFVAALAADRVFAAMFAGLLLVMSKESGMMLYGVAVLSFLAAYAPGHVTRRNAFVYALRWSPLVAPVLAAAAFLFGGTKAPGGGGGLWNGLGPMQAVGMMMRLELDRPLGSQAAALFVMSFGWLVSAFVVLWLPVAAATWRRSETELPGRRLAIALACLLFGGFFILTRFPTFSHPRYLLGLYPVLLLVFGRAVAVVVLDQRMRRALAVIVVGLLAASQVRTIDPVSKSLWGTWRFGEHELLRVTGLSRECCGYGLDGLVYNLEFVRLHELVDDLLADLRPDPVRDLVLMPRDANWFVVNRLDPETLRRTVHPRRSVRPKVRSVELGPPPPGFARYVFLALPTVDPMPAARLMAGAFRVGETRSAERDGYRIEAAVFLAPQGDTAPAP